MFSMLPAHTPPSLTHSYLLLHYLLFIVLITFNFYHYMPVHDPVRPYSYIHHCMIHFMHLLVVIIYSRLSIPIFSISYVCQLLLFIRACCLHIYDISYMYVTSFYSFYYTIIFLNLLIFPASILSLLLFIKSLILFLLCLYLVYHLFACTDQHV